MNSININSEKKFLDEIFFLAKDTFIYGVSNAVAKFISLVIFFLIIRNLSINEFGLIDYFFTIIVVCIQFVNFGLDSGVARYFHDTDNHITKKKIITQTFIFQLILIIFLLIIVLLIYNFFLKNYSIFIFHTEYFYLCLFQIPAVVIFNFSQNILKWSFARNKFILITVGNPILTLILCFAGFNFFETNIILVLKIYLIVRIIFMILSLILIRKWFIKIFNFNDFSKIIYLSIPIWIITVLITLYPFLERFYITNNLGFRELGLYAAASKIAIFILLPIEAFNTAWHPYAISIHKKENAIDYYNFIFKIFTFVICSFVLIITLFSNTFISILTTPEYLNSSILVFSLTMALVMDHIGWTPSIGISIRKKSIYFLISYSISLLFIIIFFELFINKFGLISISYIVMTAYILKSLLSSYFSQKLLKLNWDYVGPCSMILLTLLIGLLSNYIQFIYGSQKSFFFTLIFLNLFFLFSFIFALNKNDKIRITNLYKMILLKQ